MSQEYEVVHGHHARYSGFGKSARKLARQTMIDADAIAFQVVHHAMHAPQVALQAAMQPWVAETDVFSRQNLLAKFVTSGVGCIESQLRVGHQRGQIVDERASIAAQSRCISHDALGIIADHLLLHGCFFIVGA